MRRGARRGRALWELRIRGGTRVSAILKPKKGSLNVTISRELCLLLFVPVVKRHWPVKVLSYSVWLHSAPPGVGA